jgi:hypothetical protein
MTTDDFSPPMAYLRDWYGLLPLTYPSQPDGWSPREDVAGVDLSVVISASGS